MRTSNQPFHHVRNSYGSNNNNDVASRESISFRQPGIILRSCCSCERHAHFPSDPHQSLMGSFVISIIELAIVFFLDERVVGSIPLFITIENSKFTRIKIIYDNPLVSYTIYEDQNIAVID
jgi:hypothetical protein